MGALGSLLATLLLANSRNFVCQTGFSSFSTPFGGENLRNSAENLRNPGENLPAAPCLQRRTPTRVRRSREASSIRRTRRLRRERSVLDNASRTPNSLRTREVYLPPPSAGPPRCRRTPQSGDFFSEDIDLFLLLAPFWRPLVPLGALLGVLGSVLLDFFVTNLAKRAPKSDFKRS